MATTIYLFRNDLRLNDLPGLAAACRAGDVLPVYILDDVNSAERALGGASRWWLHHSLQALNHALQASGGRLTLLRGDTQKCLENLLAADDSINAMHCSRGYSPWEVALETQLRDRCEASGVTFKRYPGTLLHEPEQIANQAGEPFKVFTPFWRHCCKREGPSLPVSLPTDTRWVAPVTASITLHDLELLPRNPDWAAHWAELWTPGTEGAEQSLARFFKERLSRYARGRDHPAGAATSRLSPHLRFGEISPRQLWHAAKSLLQQEPGQEEQINKFLAELGWREFSYHLLHHFPHIEHTPFKGQFEQFPWLGNQTLLHAWQRGLTGYPVVDAGMRELWHTGYMHNRIRMVTASFLTKHLLTHWRAGERWFWNTLVDADPASNTCSWQWVAGSGADAAPYFRIFNPVTQGEKFDAEGAYVRHWVPELAKLPDRYLHHPWDAPEALLAEAGITLGATYPLPIVDHSEAREAALTAYQAVRKT
ncbi:MAG: DNA photolyase family protein [Haliea sp.]|nr:DNA photolyase family protein [Haliea sp.]